MHPYRKQTPVRFAAAFLAAAFLVVVSLCPAILRAQGAATGTITGRVLNQGTGEYVRNAVVSVAGTDISTTAEAGGNFTLLNVPAGPQKIVVKYASLDTKEVPVVVTAGQTMTQEISMTNADYDKNVVKLGEYVVATEREGAAKAIMEQKNSIEAKSVLATDTFGSISEGNVGEFLKYLPGLMIDYTEADARSVSMGGLDPQYTAVTMDGAPIASSGLAAASGTGASRGFEFEQISISSIETVEVSRTPQPENPGTAMAGIVNLRSKGAFDRSGRRITVNAGLAANSMSGNPFKKQPGWDDEDHHRVQPNFGVEYSDVFFNKRLGILAGYNYSYTFAEQKAQTIAYLFDTDLTNNATEIPRVSNFSFRDSPKPTIRYNANLRVDFKISPDLWIGARAEYNRYHAKFFSRDMTFNFTRGTTGTGAAQRWFNDIINAPDPDGSGPFPAGPVVAGVAYSLSSQTTVNNNPGVNSTGAVVNDNLGGSSVGVNQGGGGTNKYGSTSNFSVEGHYKRGPFRADMSVNMSRSMTWYKDRQFGFFWSINPGNLNNVGLRFNRNGSSDSAVDITQTAGADYRNLANYPNGFTATTNDRQGEDQRWLARADMQYAANFGAQRQLPTLFKFGVHINQWINNADRPVNNLTYTRRGPDNTASTGGPNEESLANWLEPRYRMNFDYGGNYDGVANLDRWALYKDFQAHPEWWTAPTAGALVQSALQNSRDAKEQVDAIYEQTVFTIGRKLLIAPGFRLEQTRGIAFGPTDLGDRETRRRLTGSITGTVDTASLPYINTRFGGGRQSANQDYHTWLRYLHTTYRFNEQWQVKASYNQAISRPPMDRLISGLIITNDNPDDPAPNRANAGNSDLKPEFSDTLNFRLEYYPKGVGEISVAFYRRDITNLIRRIVHVIPVGGEWNGIDLPTTVSPNEPWEINAWDNVAKAHLSSYELSFQRQLDFLPDPFKGIRFSTNYTHVDYDNYDNFLRAQNTANASLRIPYRNFTLQWNTNWREGYRNEGPVTVSGGFPRHVAESFTHTIDFGWRIRRNTTFYFTARNIFNGALSGDEYRGRSDLRTRWVKTGAILTTGVRANF
ncbi:MAG TPA: TonB-dependent receptor [Opitutaceae bacterium]|nr:TonB-dependent receptor [Opitutaceae bacterium]